MEKRIKRNRPTIGVLAGWQTYPGTIHSFLDHVFRGIQSAARDFDCNLLIGCAVNSPFQQHSNQVMPIPLPGADFIPVGPWNTDGMVIAGPLFNEPADQYFQGLIDAGFPIVYAGDRETGPSVIVDNEGGIQQAIDHLVEHGHRRIAYIAGYNASHGDSAARWRGYRTGLAKHGLTYDPDIVEIGEHLPGISYQAMRKILEKGKPFSAVIASNDESAMGAIQALRDFGLIVPNDVAVVGFDDRLEARAQIPLLTSIHHPMFELGYQSFELVFKIISGEAPQHSLVRIPTHLVIRESCGCLPGNQAIVENPTYQNDHFPIQTQYPYTHGSFLTVPFPEFTSAGLNLEKITPEISSEMAGWVHREMQHMSRHEVEYLCQRLTDAFILSLKQSDGVVFQLALQQILEHTASLDGDLYTWHGAVTILRKWIPVILRALNSHITTTAVENILHQARIAISEIQRGQYSRLVMKEAAIANLINQMSARFFSAKNEADIFQILNDTLEALNIQHVDVFYYQPDQQDPFALSEIKTSRPPAMQAPNFLTREFPPEGLYRDEHPLQLAILPLFRPNGMLGYAAFQTADMAPLGQITRQLVAALHNVQLYEETVRARKQAEEANLQKSRFLSVVSHELRTPLSLIFGLSNMLLEESKAVNEQERLVSTKDLNRIFIGAQHLESLIRDVIDLARSDVGQLELMIEPVDLKEILGMAAAIGEQLALDKDLSWNIDIPDNLPLVRADRTRLRQIVLNLVNNAVKFTVSGGITLSACANDGMVTVTVRDTGLGIPQEDQSAIFDEYRQSRRTTSRGYGGLGLGLAICKRLVEMQGGQIGVSSSGLEGEGSTFYFSIPALNTSKGTPDNSLANPAAQRVLVLVKQQTEHINLCRYLSKQGYQVNIHQVNQPGDWLPVLHEYVPDQVMLDSSLTSEHGWEILKILKENPATHDLPILFFDLQKENNQGAILDLNYLTKPLNSADLAGELTSRGLPLTASKCETSRPILIVDDDPEILELHTRILKTIASGYTFRRAYNGREALDIIRRERPALVLLDLMMPDIDGFEVLEAMQAEDLIRSTQVIVLTSQVLTETDMARLNCGVASILAKGMYTVQETLDHVSDALARRRRSGIESRRMILKAIAYLHAHYRDPISRSDIASYIGVSERHLSRCFQQEVGLTPMTYLNRLRVKMAKNLLEARQMSITDIAMEVGFSTGGYFARVFREEVGISPRQFIKDREAK